jgi:hypothetical protein
MRPLIIVRRIAYLFFVLSQLIGCDSKYEMKYYDNGLLKSKKSIKNGIYSGDFYTYYPDGRLESKGRWTNGEGNGYMEKYFQNGKIKQRANYKNDKLEGNAEVFHDNGAIQLRASYVGGEKVGKYHIYRDDGNLSELHLYDKTGRVYYIAKWEQGGKKIMELVFPLFDAVDQRDSLALQIHVLVKYGGTGKITIGYKDGNNINPVVPPIIVSDTIPITMMLSKKYSLSDLYYSFDFRPSPDDTLASVLFDFPLVRGIKTERADDL